MTIEGLKNYRVSNRRYRNRRIGDFLKELRLTEGRNTGFKKIVDALAANGSPKPQFETDDSRTYFITRLFVHEKFSETSDKSGIESGIENGIDGIESGTEKGMAEQYKNKLGVFTEKKRVKMLELIRAIEADQNMSQDMLAKRIDVGKRTVARYLDELSDMEIVERVGAAKGGKYLIKKKIK